MDRTFLFLALFSLITLVGSQRKIVGGIRAPVGSNPWLVSLYEDGEHQCGGVIIGPRTVLTAAHCLPGRFKRLFVRAGSMRIESGGVLARASGWRTPPCYNAESGACDIGIIFLRNNLTFTDRIQPIGLYDGNLVAGQSATVSGWGLLRVGGSVPEYQRMVNVRVIARRNCRKAYPDIPRSLFCAGYMSGGRDACYWDSGGPLVSEGGLIGIVSDGHGCALRGYPGVYTRVLMFKRWLRRYSKVK